MWWEKGVFASAGGDGHAQDSAGCSGGGGTPSPAFWAVTCGLRHLQQPMCIPVWYLYHGRSI